MRTLTRPMFNWGGPVKQGIMHGIREPYKYGGPTGTGLVGDRRYPRTGGREHHAFFIPPLWAAASGLARFAPSIYRAAQAGLRGRNLSATYKLGKVGSRGGATGAGGMGTGSIRGGAGVPMVIPQASRGSRFMGALPPWLRTSLERDPIVGAGRWGYKALTSPTAKGLGQKVLRGVATPTGAGTLIYFGGKWLWPDGTEATDAEVKTELNKKGGKDYGPHTKGKLTLTQEQREAKAKADKEKRINDLLDTMGYDKARKTAAYDALIDAGRMVSERGTLDPKNIGRELIDPIVATTSARFDKPEQIREAVGLMQVKADIAKQMEDPQIKELRAKQIEQADKALAGNTLEETAEALYTRHGTWPSGEKLANLARNKGIAITEVVDTAGEEVGDAVEYMEGRVKKFRDQGIEIPPGNYVVDKSIIIIDSEGNVSRR